MNRVYLSARPWTLVELEEELEGILGSVGLSRSVGLLGLERSAGLVEKIRVSRISREV